MENKDELYIKCINNDRKINICNKIYNKDIDIKCIKFCKDLTNYFNNKEIIKICIINYCLIK